MPITVMNHVTLDGVMQAPGRKDEDTRGGFAHGGWAMEGNDEVMGQFMGERMGQGGSLLLGRRTCQDVLSYWNNQPDNPFVAMLNDQQKYVASTSLSEPLPWPNSTRLEGDAAAAVATLQAAQPEEQLAIMGSRSLVHAVMERDLIDEWLLMIHPIRKDL